MSSFHDRLQMRSQLTLMHTFQNKCVKTFHDLRKTHQLVGRSIKTEICQLSLEGCHVKFYMEIHGFQGMNSDDCLDPLTLLFANISMLTP